MRSVDFAVTLLTLATILATTTVLYRYLTSNATRLYTNVLADALGSWAEHIIRSPLNADLRLRGSFQFTKISPPRMQLPLSRDAFVAAFERTAPGPYGEALAILARMDQFALLPSPTEESNSGSAAEADWKRFVSELSDGAPSDFVSFEILEQANRQRTVAAMRAGLWELFPDMNGLISGYPDFISRLAYTKRRRNLRQLVVIAVAMTLASNQTINRLFSASSSPSFVLFDITVMTRIPALILRLDIWQLAHYVGGCLVTAITITGIADVLDRFLFGQTGVVEIPGAESPRDSNH